MTVALNHRISKDPISLRDALRQCAAVFQPAKPRATVALLYSADRCRLAVLAVEGNAHELQVHLLDERDNEMPAALLDHVFEARVFNENAELRWLQRAERKGDASLLSVQDQDISGCLDEAAQPDCLYDQLDELEPLEQRYLLWGEGTGVTTAGGWQHLTAARIGYLDVPLTDPAIQDGGRVQLVACEYLREVDEHGNVAVVEERLLKLEVVR